MQEKTRTSGLGRDKRDSGQHLQLCAVLTSGSMDRGFTESDFSWPGREERTF